MTEKQKKDISCLKRCLAISRDYLPRYYKFCTIAQLQKELLTFKQRLKCHIADIFYIVITGTSVFDPNEYECELKTAVMCAKQCYYTIKITNMEIEKRAA